MATSKKSSPHDSTYSSDRLLHTVTTTVLLKRDTEKVLPPTTPLVLHYEKFFSPVPFVNSKLIYKKVYLIV